MLDRARRRTHQRVGDEDRGAEKELPRGAGEEAELVEERRAETEAEYEMWLDFLRPYSPLEKAKRDELRRYEAELQRAEARRAPKNTPGLAITSAIAFENP